MQAWSPQEKPQDYTNWQLWVCLFSIDSISGRKKKKKSMNQCMNHVTTELSKYPPADKAALRPFVAWFWLVPQNLFLFLSEPFALIFLL